MFSDSTQPSDAHLATGPQGTQFGAGTTPPVFSHVLGSIPDCSDRSARSEKEMAATLEALVAQLHELQEAVDQRDALIARMQHESREMEGAQADAIIHSVEIIDELERTREHLSVAQIAAEKAAQDTQRLADTIFENTHDGVLVFRDRACIACNRDAARLLGGERDGLIGQWPDVLTEAVDASGANVSDAIWRASAPSVVGEVTTHEVLLPVDHSEPIWAEIVISSFLMKEEPHCLMVIRDISRQKALETELRQHRDFLDNVINAVPDPLSVKSSDHTLLIANDAYCDRYQIVRQECIGQSERSWLPKALFRSTIDIEKQVLATGLGMTKEYDMDADGRKRRIVAQHSRFQDSASEEYFIVTTSRDVTEERDREEQLRTLASVFNNTSEGAAILTIHGVVQEANPAFHEMVSYEQRTVLGSLLTDALCFEANHFQDILNQLRAGHAWSGKATGRNPLLPNRSFWVSLSPSFDVQNNSKHIIALISNITELEAAQKKLHRQAYYDNLTGLPNRRRFREQLEELIRVQDASLKYAICFIDLDDFKQVNDTTGHSAGDQLLKAVGKRLKQVLGPQTTVARFGGDEFALIIPREDGHDDVQEKLKELLEAFREPFQLGSCEPTVGLSIGVTHFPEQATDVSTLMSHADIAMYAAKSHGKNHVRIFHPSMQEDVNTRHQIQTKLRRALSGGNISLYYQPKVCALTGQPVGCEALARWQTESGKFISPGEFIPIAEQSGLILLLGEYVFRMAAEQAVQWHAAGLSPMIAVNVSPQQLRHPDFVSELQRTLEQTGARAEWFELEITEYAMMDDVEHTIDVLERLARLGFEIAIDDFGTGYSSLSYLKDFPIHTLKIDMSFVTPIGDDLASRAIVQSIASLGNGLGLKVIAEGVEHKEQSEILKEAGCTILQGYYFGKPMPPQAFQQWWTEANRK